MENLIDKMVVVGLIVVGILGIFNVEINLSPICFVVAALYLKEMK